LAAEEGRLDEHIRYVQLQLRKLSEDPRNARNAFVTYEDLMNLTCFQNDTLIAIKAPSGTRLEVPDPDEGMLPGQRRYQIFLKSPSGEPIDVFLLQNRQQMALLQEQQRQQQQQQELLLQQQQQQQQQLLPVVGDRSETGTPTSPSSIFEEETIVEGGSPRRSSSSSSSTSTLTSTSSYSSTTSSSPRSSSLVNSAEISKTWSGVQAVDQLITSSSVPLLPTPSLSSASSSSSPPLLRTPSRGTLLGEGDAQSTTTTTSTSGGGVVGPPPPIFKLAASSPQIIKLTPGSSLLYGSMGIGMESEQDMETGLTDFFTEEENIAAGMFLAEGVDVLGEEKCT